MERHLVKRGVQRQQLQFIVRQDTGDLAAKGSVEGCSPGRGVGDEHPAAAKVLPQPDHLRVGQVEVSKPRHDKHGIVKQCVIVEVDQVAPELYIEGSVALKVLHQVYQGVRRRIPVAVVDDLCDDELVPRGVGLLGVQFVYAPRAGVLEVGQRDRDDVDSEARGVFLMIERAAVNRMVNHVPPTVEVDRGEDYGWPAAQVDGLQVRRDSLERVAVLAEPHLPDLVVGVEQRRVGVDSCELSPRQNGGNPRAGRVHELLAAALGMHDQCAAIVKVTLKMIDQHVGKLRQFGPAGHVKQRKLGGVPRERLQRRRYVTILDLQTAIGLAHQRFYVDLRRGKARLSAGLPACGANVGEVDHAHKRRRGWRTLALGAAQRRGRQGQGGKALAAGAALRPGAGRLAGLWVGPLLGA